MYNYRYAKLKRKICNKNNKAVPIKYFVSHRLTNPKVKKKFQDSLAKEANTLIYKHTILFINNNWYDVMSFSLINIDTMFFKGCFDSRVNTHLLQSDYVSNRVNVGFNNQGPVIQSSIKLILG